MKYTIFLSLEPYLAQWFQKKAGGDYPIPIKRGSAESDILEMYLSPQPKTPGYIVQHKALPGQVEIVLPDFAYKDIHTYNYLPPEGQIRLRSCIRTRFCVELWKDLQTVGNVIKRKDIAISKWMQEHGIENDERNWNTIAKILQRKRAIYSPNGRLTTHKTGKHRKK